MLDSLSRLMSAVAKPQHAAKARMMRKRLASYVRSEDLIRVGAYQKGADPELDQAVNALPALLEFLQQRVEDRAPFNDTLTKLAGLPE